MSENWHWSYFVPEKWNEKNIYQFRIIGQLKWLNKNECISWVFGFKVCQLINFKSYKQTTQIFKSHNLPVRICSPHCKSFTCKHAVCDLTRHIQCTWIEKERTFSVVEYVALCYCLSIDLYLTQPMKYVCPILVLSNKY